MSPWETALPLPNWAAAQMCTTFSRPQFPNLGKIQPRSWFPSSLKLGPCCSSPQGGRLCFECSAALAGPRWALPCFVSAAGLSTDAVLAAAQRSPVERFPPSQNCWPLQYEPKGCAEQNCTTSSRILPGATEGQARLLPSSLQGLLWALRHQRCLCLLPSG